MKNKSKRNGINFVENMKKYKNKFKEEKIEQIEMK